MFTGNVVTFALSSVRGQRRFPKSQGERTAIGSLGGFYVIGDADFICISTQEITQGFRQPSVTKSLDGKQIHIFGEVLTPSFANHFSFWRKR